jgi:hypothetical protein
MKSIRKRHSGLNATSALGGIAVLGLTYLFIRSLPELIRYVRMNRM